MLRPQDRLRLPWQRLADQPLRQLRLALPWQTQSTRAMHSTQPLVPPRRLRRWRLVLTMLQQQQRRRPR